MSKSIGFFPFRLNRELISDIRRLIDEGSLTFNPVEGASYHGNQVVKVIRFIRLLDFGVRVCIVGLPFAAGAPPKPPPIPPMPPPACVHTKIRLQQNQA